MQAKFALVPSEDGSMDEPLSYIEVVHQVLSKKNRKPTFLKNISIRTTSTSKVPKSQLQVQLEAEKEGNQKLLSIIEELQKFRETAKAERLKYDGDMQEMRLNEKWRRSKMIQMHCSSNYWHS
jgi:hypothetical protein